MMYFDQLIFLLPALILAGLASLYTQLTFKKYSKYRSRSGLTGAEAAQRMLDHEGVHDVKIEAVDGFLSDHYDPTSKTLRLSTDVYGSSSLSAIGVACHEAGHALQHAGRYAPLHVRTALVPVTQIGSHAAYLFFLLGMLLQSFQIAAIGALLFGLAVIFSIVTLPVEWNASSRAKKLMVSAGIVSSQEQIMAGSVLNAAFLTYVSAAFMAILQFIYYLMKAGLLGRRND